MHVDDIQIKPIQQLFSQASKKGKYALEFEHAIKDNDVKWILAQINKAKATKELILVLHDETQLRQMDSMRRDFIANLSHELQKTSNSPRSTLRLTLMFIWSRFRWKRPTWSTLAPISETLV